MSETRIDAECAHCGEEYGDHASKNDACPIRDSRRTIGYSASKRFLERRAHPSEQTP